MPNFLTKNKQNLQNQNKKENKNMRIYGKNTCTEFLKSKSKIKKIYLQKTVDEKFKNEILSLNSQVNFCDKDFLNKLTNFKNHQGIVIETEDFKFSSLEEIINLHNEKNSKAFILILDNIEDPQNLGSLIRSSVCGNVDGIVIPKNHSCGITETVYKVSSGALNHIKICEVNNINDAIKKIKNENIFVYGLEAGEKYIYDVDLAYNIALVVGSEGKGISKLTKSLCDEIVSIPIGNKINSLNAGVAGAIGIFEVVRQRV